MVKGPSPIPPRAAFIGPASARITYQEKVRTMYEVKNGMISRKIAQRRTPSDARKASA